MTDKKKEVAKTESKEVAKAPPVDPRTINGFSSVLKNYEKSIAQLLHNKYGISPEEFYVSAVNAIKKQPKLLQCDLKSLFGAILLSAEIGLRFNTPAQHAFILPYGKEAKFIIGYKGLIEIMYRNPRVLSITAEVVKENDEFDYGYGLNPFLNHKPKRNGDRGKVECVYAVCKLKDADPIFTVVERAQLDEIRELSKSKNSEFSPYNNNTDVHHFMEIKAGIKKLSKLIPTSSNLEISKAVEYDSRFEGGASVKAELPIDGDVIIQAEISDSSPNSLANAFDDVEEVVVTIEESPKEEKVKEKVKESPESKSVAGQDLVDKAIAQKEKNESKKVEENPIDNKQADAKELDEKETKSADESDEVDYFARGKGEENESDKDEDVEEVDGKQESDGNFAPKEDIQDVEGESTEENKDEDSDEEDINQKCLF